MKDKESIAGFAQTLDLGSASAVSILNGSHPDLDSALIPKSVEKDVDCILDGWESAVEDDETDKSTRVKVREEEIEVEGITYIASVLVESESVDGLSIQERNNVGPHDELPLAAQEQQADEQSTAATATVINSPTLDATRYHGYSIDYATTCMVELEVHILQSD